MAEKQKLYFKLITPIYRKIYNDEDISHEEIREAFSEYLPHSNKSEYQFIESVINSNNLDEAIKVIKDSRGHNNYVSLLNTTKQLRSSMVVNQRANHVNAFEQLNTLRSQQRQIMEMNLGSAARAVKDATMSSSYLNSMRELTNSAKAFALPSAKDFMGPSLRESDLMHGLTASTHSINMATAYKDIAPGSGMQDLGKYLYSDTMASIMKSFGASDKISNMMKDLTANTPKLPKSVLESVQFTGLNNINTFTNSLSQIAMSNSAKINIMFNTNMSVSIPKSEFNRVYGSIDDNNISDNDKVKIASIICFVNVVAPLFFVISDLQDNYLRICVALKLYTDGMSRGAFKYLRDPEKVGGALANAVALKVFWMIIEYIIKNKK